MENKKGRTLAEMQELEAKGLTEIAMFRVNQERLKRAKAMQCFGMLVHFVESDPDPKTQDKLQKEYNCKNCDTYQYCCKLADTLL